MYSGEVYRYYCVLHIAGRQRKREDTHTGSGVRVYGTALPGNGGAPSGEEVAHAAKRRMSTRVTGARDTRQGRGRTSISR